MFVFFHNSFRVAELSRKLNSSDALRVYLEHSVFKIYSFSFKWAVRQFLLSEYQIMFHNEIRKNEKLCVHF